jgi:glycine cleavage system aminomethyltransferase T
VKAYRAWGADITTGAMPCEAGFGFMLKLDKATDFIGKEALLQGPCSVPPVGPFANPVCKMRK